MYIANRFNFNGYPSGESIFDIHLDATKPITIDPRECTNYDRMFENCWARSIIVPKLNLFFAGSSAERMFCGAWVSSFTVPKGFWSKLAYCKHMLSGCTNLSSIDMSEEDGGALSGLREMDYMFDYCTSLTSIEFPAGSGTQLTAKRINGGFANCTNLQKLVFPAGFGGKIG